MEEIGHNFFRIEIPLPNSSLKYLNSYVIKGEDRNLIIDTGMNLEECLKVMLDNLKALDIDLQKTDFFITHLHGDHFGLVPRLAHKESKIYFNGPEAEFLKTLRNFDGILAYLTKNGFPEDQLQVAVTQFPARRHDPNLFRDLDILKDGDIIRAGDYNFTCIETPGHSNGHMCLYEKDKKILIAGDHLLIDITPSINCLSDDTNPLKLYLESLDKVGKLEVELVLPGHRRLFSDLDRRIRELKEHHDNRLGEIVGILEKGEMDAFRVAAEMSWDVHCDTWEEVPANQKWFATGEAIAHLRYLEEEQKVTRIDGAELTEYRLI